MNLDISTGIDFVKDRTEKTAAVQATLATVWHWRELLPFFENSSAVRASRSV